MSDTVRRDGRNLDDTQRLATIVGGVGLVILLVGWLLSQEQFFRSYLLGFLFWTGIGLGSLGLAALHQLTGGAWGMVLRRMFEASARTLPFMALLFVPLIFGLHHIYIWSHADVVAADPLLEYKSGWLNIPFFVARSVFYFAVWTIVGYLLSRWSVALDTNPDPREARRLRLFSAVGLLLMVLTVTFAAFDWVMSLDPHWFSSIFGAIMAVGMILAAFSAAIIGLRWLAGREPMPQVLTTAIFNDLGSMLLAFTMLWAYLSLSQFLIIWSGNLPEEAIWYLERNEGTWHILAVVLPLFHFAVPFVLLLSRGVRSNLRRLSWLAAYILFMHLLELVWLVKPTFTHGLSIHWLDVVSIVAFGGLWLALFLWQLKQHPLVPLPAITELRERAHAAH